MGNVSDYLKWRGDLSFEQDPFNDVDNLVLSQLAYVNLKNIVPEAGTGQTIILGTASELFFSLNSEEKLRNDKTFTREVPYLLRDAAATRRFSEVVLSNYVDEIDEHEEKQFAAFQCGMPDGTTYIAFRGTDDTIVGWKEDFNMSFMSPVPSQLHAVKYINSTVSSKAGKLRLGGHSKGGNLAIYAAVKADKQLQRRIIEVYNNDGPGFDRNMIESEEYQQMLPRIKTIVPYHSVVGMLLEHEEEYMVVKSNQTGIMQHDGNSWQVCGNHFLTNRKLSKESAVLKDAMSEWINSLDTEERARFVEALFAVVTASGAKTLSDINSDIFKSANAALKMFNSLDADTRGMLLKLFRSFTVTLKKARRKGVVNV